MSLIFINPIIILAKAIFTPNLLSLLDFLAYYFPNYFKFILIVFLDERQ